MKLKVLIISDVYSKKFSGGAYISLRIIVKSLLEQKDLSLKILAREVEKKHSEKISLIPLNPIVSLVQNKLQKTLSALGSDYFLYVFQILREIKKFKPQIIITQRNVAFPTIFCAKITNTPVIHIIRDTTNFCPKHVDIFRYGQSCPEYGNKKICYECINYWRSLRVFLGDKTIGWENSLKAAIYTIFYKFRYRLIKLNFKLMNKATNILASPWLKQTLSVNINPEKLHIINITPIQKIKDYSMEPNERIKKKIESFKHPLLFITPKFKGYQKGDKFIVKLAKLLPDEYAIVIVGKKLNLKEIPKKIINIDFVTSEVLNWIYKKSKLTLVPSFLTDTFGRIVIESFINKTPVIASPNCGVNVFFKDKPFLKVISLNLNSWRKEIVQLIENTPIITDEDVKKIYEQFSENKSIQDIMKLINQLLSKREGE